jgi:ribosomal protein S18 acetylase RimI-like enzyme
MNDFELREAGRDERDNAAAVLAHALRDGSYVGYLTANSSNQIAALEAYFKACFDSCQRRFAIGGDLGFALWELPGSRSSLIQNLKMIPVILRFDYSKLPLCLRAMKAKAKAKPTADHYYLSVVGVHPDHQSRGLGAKLLGPILQECDQRKIGAYLETSNPRNIPFYERLGFKIRERMAVPGGEMVTMWQDPRLLVEERG